MPRLNTPVASRPAPVDRNPTSVHTRTTPRLSENQSLTTEWTYTVPSDRKAAIGSLALILEAEIAATSTTVLDTVTLTIQLTPTGSVADIILRVMMNTVAYVAGTSRSIVIGQGAFLESGDVLTAESVFGGDAAGAGRILAAPTLWTMEFDS